MPGFVSANEREVVIERSLAQHRVQQKSLSQRKTITSYQRFTDIGTCMLKRSPCSVRRLAGRLSSRRRLECGRAIKHACESEGWKYRFGFLLRSEAAGASFIDCLLKEFGQVSFNKSEVFDHSCR